MISYDMESFYSETILEIHDKKCTIPKGFKLRISFNIEDFVKHIDKIEIISEYLYFSTCKNLDGDRLQKIMIELEELHEIFNTCLKLKGHFKEYPFVENQKKLKNKIKEYRNKIFKNSLEPSKLYYFAYDDVYNLPRDFTVKQNIFNKNNK